MELWKKYKHFIIGFGILFWGFAKIIGIQEWGSVIFGIAVFLAKMDDIIEYAKKIGIVKFAILISIFVAICGLTALIFIRISEYFTLSIISKMVITILGLIIDLLIMGYAIKNLERMK